MMGVTNFDALAADGIRVEARLWRGIIESEDTISSGAWVTAPLAAEIEDDGFSVASNEITIGSELDGKVLMFDVMASFFGATATGYFKVRLMRQPSGGSYSAVLEGKTATTSGSEGTARAVGYRKLIAGEKYKVELTVSAGSVDLDMNNGIVALVAL